MISFDVDGCDCVASIRRVLKLYLFVIINYCCLHHRSLKLSEYHEQDEILRLRTAALKKVCTTTITLKIQSLLHSVGHIQFVHGTVYSTLIFIPSFLAIKV